MKVVVQKFGGTSLNDKQKLLKVMKHIKKEIDNGVKVIVVTSAIGRFPEPYATDTLKSLITQKISSKEVDRLLACGEIISSVVIADFLLQQGINVISLSTSEIGIHTNDKHNDANIINVSTDLIINKFKKYDVVVIPGFQGVNENGDVTTLGRGGSDTTAVALADKLNALYVDIVSDVRGIYSADPKIISNTKLWEEVGMNFLVKMSINGAKVIHHKAAIIAQKNNTKIRFSLLGDIGAGTVVIDNDKKYFTLIYTPNYAKIHIQYPLINLDEENKFESVFFVEEDKATFIEEALKKENIKFEIEKDYVKIVMLKSETNMVNEEIAYVKKSESLQKLEKKHDALMKLFTTN